MMKLVVDKKIKYYEEMDSILGCKPATKPNLIVRSNSGIVGDSIDLEDSDDDCVHLSPVCNTPDSSTLEVCVSKLIFLIMVPFLII